MRLYNTGLVIGRFQPLHNGHVAMIERALELCNTVVVYVGSAQPITDILVKMDNPFSYEIRVSMLTQVFRKECESGRLQIRPLYDIGAGNNDIWGRYILGLFKEEFHKQPDLYLSGCELARSSWFNSDIAPKMDELRISRHGINISGTECRELLLAGKKEAFFEFVPKVLEPNYEIYKQIIKDAQPEEAESV